MTRSCGDVATLAPARPVALDPAAIPLALYVHLPWCVRKCPYCDFNSYTRDGAIPEREYVEALLADLDRDAHYAAGRALASIFIGGGTPSLFSGDAIARLLDGVRARLDFAADAEITLEANPGAVDAQHFAAYRRAGVNRLSIGVQSFRPAQLAALGRIHDVADIERAIATARDAGFDNFNLDLMHGLPGDTPDDALRDLERALAFAPPHLSWYQLTLEPGTAFGRKPPPLPPHDRIAEEFERGCALLASHGLQRYEISAFASSGRAARHNLNYWQFGDYLGIGAGAHGKLTTAAGILRTEKRRQPAAYMKAVNAGQPAGRASAVAARDLPSEFMLNALRLRAGFDRAWLAERAGLGGDADDALAEAVTRGWLSDDGARVVPTELGYRFVDDLQLLFIS
ncbi:MAG: radical SAM family heme chaperone HemW [Gammaproteobacteria bacterium]